MKFAVTFLIFLSFYFQIEASNILAVWPVLSRAHFMVGLSFFEKLAEDGHTVSKIVQAIGDKFPKFFVILVTKITLISPYELKDSHENLKFVKLEKVASSVNVVTVFQMRNMSTFELIKYNIESARDLTDFALSDTNMKEFLKTEEKFDLFMFDFFLNEAILGIAYYLKLPVIAFSSSGSSRYLDEIVKNPFNPSYNPKPFLGFNDEMTFCERVINTVFSIYDKYLYHFWYLPSQQALLKEHFSELIGGPIPRISDLIQNIDLVLLNSHPITQPPRAQVPNSIEVGGVHLRALNDQVHPEFIKTMDRAINGIIYFSLGDSIKSSDLPEEKLEAFLKVFDSMKNVLVLWKFESIALRERHGTNVIIGPWLPQQEILNHRNLKVFITHGGLLSSMEALNYGKPIIGVPFFNDQKFNMARAESQGYGLTLDYDSLNEASLKNAIETIFNDTSYQENAEKLSIVFRDNPIKPIDKATHYVEHVIRNGGAGHLKTAATKLSLCTIHLVDQLILVLTLITATLIAIFALSKGMKWLKTKFQKRRGKLHPIKSSNRNKFKSN